MRSVYLVLSLLMCFSSIAQTGILDEVQSIKNEGILFEEFTPLERLSNSDSRILYIEKVQNATFFHLNKEKIYRLRVERPGAITFSMVDPVGKRLDLELVEHSPFSPDFQLKTSEKKLIVPYDQGLHYRGIVRGDNNSIVSLSVFNDELFGMISTSSTNFTIGKMDIPREEIFVIYEEEALGLDEGLYCQTPDDGRVYTAEELKASYDSRDEGDCIRLYVEIDDDVVTDKGGAIPAANFTTALFNELITLYANENIEVSLSELYAWTSSSPYSGSTSSAMLSSFQMYTGSFNGDLAHLISYKASGGIAAGFSGICNANPDESKCFSSISATYSSYPAYSWSVMVITHEMGHLLGSRHTHACVWNGNGTAIDGCAGATEGSCSLPGNPAGGGTIMSYCHLTSVGINPILGFGPQPGTVIRNTVNAAGNCLTGCSGPPPPAAYCASSGNNQNYEFIQAVAVESINNNSGNNSGYGDFSSMSTNLNAGATYTLTCTPGFGGGAYTEYWSAWIDYNNDLDFDDVGEMVGQGSANSIVHISFTVPTNSPSVSSRMRVSMSYGGYTSSCGSFSYGEVEDYTLNILAGTTPTCNDGVQNGDETGIDCGGSYCPECSTCDDGIQNGDETGVDCGGSCEPCITCDDGIQNGDETGIDCGGSCPECPGGINEVFGHYFETGWDGWSDGGSDCARYSGSRSWEGSYAIRIRDNSGVASATTSSAYDVSGYTSLDLKFYFYAYSMETGEDFWLRYYDGSSWHTVAAFVSGTSFNNGGFYSATVNISEANFNMASNAKFRFQCDASANYDLIYIDEVTLTGNSGTTLPGQQITIEELEKPHIAFTSQINDSNDEDHFEVYPNPTRDVIRLECNSEVRYVVVLSSSGQLIKRVDLQHNHEIDLSDLKAGLYIIMADHEGERVYKRIVKY